MDTIRFAQFYNSGTIIHGYVSDSKNYIDSDNLKDIIDKLESIKTNIEKEIDNNLEQNFRESLKICKFRNDDKKCAKLANINSDYCNIHKSFAEKGEEDDLLKMIGIVLEDDIDEDDIDEDDIDEDDIDEDDIDEDDIDEDKSVYYIKYLESMIGFVKRELKLNYYLKNTLIKFTNGDKSSCNKYIDSAKYILTKDLNIISVIAAMKQRLIPKIDFGINLYSTKKDYTGNKQELFKLIQKEQNDNKITEEDIYNFIDEDIYKDEDKTLMRQLVLKFEHPDNYINEFGDYNYGNISDYKDDYLCDIKILAKSFMFRSKTRRHFEYLNRVIPYEYNEMKESRKLLHSELKSLYKIFQRRMVDIPLAIAIKNE